MAALLMSIGLSVDFTAHTVYHYYDGRESGVCFCFLLKLEFICSGQFQMHPLESMTETVATITKPLLQSATTTILAGVIPVISGTYIGVVFCKTLVLVSY